MMLKEVGCLLYSAGNMQHPRAKLDPSNRVARKNFLLASLAESGGVEILDVCKRKEKYSVLAKTCLREQSIPAPPVKLPGVR
jgi:hypothetical protein